MARVDAATAPDVEARVSAPDDYQHIQASPEAFGAGIGGATQALGQNLTQVAGFYSKVAADQGVNNTLQQATNLLYGDPSKQVQGPDGTMIPDTGYFGRRGADAMSARADTEKALDAIIAQNRQGLQTPEAIQEYENESRRYRAQWAHEIGAHADQQQKIWATDTNNTAATIAENDLGRAPLDPNMVSDATQRLTKAYVRNAQLAGEDPAGAILKAQQGAALARVRALVGSDNPADREAAEKLVADNRGLLSSLPNYDQIVHSVKTAVVDAKLGPATDKFVSDVVNDVRPQVGAPGGTPTASDLAGAILRQESSNRSSAPTSVDGAVGPGQIKPGTFARFAKPGEVITNPADNRAVAARAIDHYVQEYHGDTQRASVAYFSGEGNVAPPDSPTPWKHDFKDGNGKSTSAYVADVQARLAKYPSTADALNANLGMIEERAQKEAERQFPNYPDAQERFVSNAMRRVQQTISQYSRQYEVDTHTVQTAMVNSHPISEAQLRAMGPDVSAAWDRMQIENPYGAMGVQHMFDANAQGKSGVYGVGFKDYLDRVLADPHDANRISNPSQLWPYVGSGPEAALTNSGVEQLSNLMKGMGGPTGTADAAQIRNFVDQAYGTLTYANRQSGLTDPKGEAIFGKFMASALPVLVQAQKDGTLPKVLDPKSPDYIGKVAQTFARTPAEIVRDRLGAEGRLKTQAGMPAPTTPEGLKMAVASGQIPRDEGEWIATQLGFIAAPGAAPKKPWVPHAPPPTIHPVPGLQ